MKTIAVLGTGNVAQTIAVDMKAKGQEVRLFAPDYLFSRFQTIAISHASANLTQKKRSMW